MKIVFLYQLEDQDSREIYDRLTREGYHDKIKCIEVDDSKTIQWLRNNKEGIVVDEIPCFIVKDNNGSRVYSYRDYSHIVSLLDKNDLF